LSARFVAALVVGGADSAVMWRMMNAVMRHDAAAQAVVRALILRGDG